MCIRDRPEAWVTDYDGDGEIDALEEMRFNDQELGGRYFSAWTSYRHPEEGDLEVGGWHRKFWGQNPPAEFLQEECAAQLPWIFYLMEQSPRLALQDPTITPLGDGRFRIRATVFNEGFLPTSLTGRGAVGQETADGSLRNPVVQPPVLFLGLEGAEIVEGSERVQVGHLQGTGPFLTDIGAASEVVEWIVQAHGPSSYVQVTARSHKAGVSRSEWVEIR